MKHLKTLTVCVVFFTLLIPAAWSQINCQITAYGYVTDTDGNPIAGALVLADTSGTTTDANGYYSISRIQLNCNGYYVEVSADGYETETQYTPSGTGSYQLDFVLSPVMPTCWICTITVSGTVKDINGNPLPGAQVNENGIPVLETDSQGQFSFNTTAIDPVNSDPLCPVGDMMLEVNLPSHAADSIFVPLTCNDAEFNVTMHKYGDVNSDGSTTVVDALMIARYYIGLTDPGFSLHLANVNGDSAVTILDALIVAQYYVGLIDELPLL